MLFRSPNNPPESRFKEGTIPFIEKYILGEEERFHIINDDWSELYAYMNSLPVQVKSKFKKRHEEAHKIYLRILNEMAK